MAAALALGLGLTAGSAGANSYIGAARCKSCHEFEYEVWASGPHAIAHRALTSEQLTQAKCNTCHTMLPEDLSEKYIGVQCERCHGAGRYYQHDFVMKDRELSRAVGLIDVTAVHCEQCHNDGAPSIEPFDYKTMWKEIDHGPEARAAWEAAKAGRAKGGAASGGAASGGAAKGGAASGGAAKDGGAAKGGAATHGAAGG